MLSEGVHSLVDTANELLLLYGMKRAARPPDTNHPLGHGRELYFWSFIVALMVLALGAAASFYEGIVSRPSSRNRCGIPCSTTWCSPHRLDSRARRGGGTQGIRCDQGQPELP